MDSPDSVDRGSPDNNWEYNPESDLDEGSDYWEEDSVWKDSPGSDWTDMPHNLWNDKLDYVTKDVNRTVWKDSPDRVTENMPRNVWKDSPRDITKDLPEGVWKDSPENVTEDLPDNVWKDNPSGVTEDLPDNVWKDSPCGFTEDIPASVWKDSTGGDWKVPKNIMARSLPAKAAKVYKELSRSLFNDSRYCVLKYSHFSFRRNLPDSFRRGSSASLEKDPTAGHSGYRKTSSPTAVKERSSGMIRVSSAGNIRKEDYNTDKKHAMRSRKKSGSTDIKYLTKPRKGSADSVTTDSPDCSRKASTGSLKKLSLATVSKDSTSSVEAEFPIPDPGRKISTGSIEKDPPITIKKDPDDSCRKVSISSDPGPSCALEKVLKEEAPKDSEEPLEDSPSRSKEDSKVAAETDPHEDVSKNNDGSSEKCSTTQSLEKQDENNMTSEKDVNEP